MTAENPQFQPPRDLGSPYSGTLEENLMALDTTNVEGLNPTEPYVREVAGLLIMQEKFNPDADQSQTLRAVITAGDELFGVVGVGPLHAAHEGNAETLMLTRFSKVPGLRAEIAGILKPGEPFLVGRGEDSPLKDKFSDLDGKMSRKHFSIALSRDGQHLGVHDEGSMNGTQVITSKTKSQDEILRAMPDYRVWGPSSKDTKNALAESQGINPLSWRSDDTPRVQEPKSRVREPMIGELDVKPMAEMLSASRALGIELDELESITDKPYQLELESGSGKIILSNEGKGLIFSVDKSDDPLVKPGKRIYIQGASISGGAMASGFIGPNSRAAFTQTMKPETFTISEAEGPRDMTKEEFEKGVKAHPNAYKLENDGTVTVTGFDPSPRATDFLAHAKITIIGEDGVETRELF